MLFDITSYQPAAQMGIAISECLPHSAVWVVLAAGQMGLCIRFHSKMSSADFYDAAYAKNIQRCPK